MHALSPTEQRISKNANLSVILGVLGIFLCGLILCPFAIGYANRARDAIFEEDVGHQFLSQANLGRILGYIGIALWALGAVVRVVATLV
ncbi:MAG: hypothetical protein R3B13_16850 [Polyangiaceae bacterium]